jgi:hypothetical protein
VTFQRERLFGEIIDSKMGLNRRGEIVREEWFASAKIRKEIRLFPEEFVVMPNQIHGIPWIENNNDSPVNSVGGTAVRHWVKAQKQVRTNTKQVQAHQMHGHGFFHSTHLYKGFRWHFKMAFILV